LFLQYQNFEKIIIVYILD